MGDGLNHLRWRLLEYCAYRQYSEGCNPSIRTVFPCSTPWLFWVVQVFRMFAMTSATADTASYIYMLDCRLEAFFLSITPNIIFEPSWKSATRGAISKPIIIIGIPSIMSENTNCRQGSSHSIIVVPPTGAAGSNVIFPCLPLFFFVFFCADSPWFSFLFLDIPFLI